MGHKTLIGDTTYDIKGGRTLIGGTNYDIKKGRTYIGSTSYDISFGTPLGELAVGTSVYMNVNAVREEWIIVHQGKPSGYDDTGYGTWCLLKDIYSNVNRGTQTYYFFSPEGIIAFEKGCAHDVYLTGTFFPLMDANIQSIIKTVNVPDIDFNNKTAARKIFLPHWNELSTTPLTYFEDNSDSRRIAYYNGRASYWSLRNKLVNSSNDTFQPLVWSTGAKQTTNILTSGIRPLVVLPDDAIIDENFNVVA